MKRIGDVITSNSSDSMIPELHHKSGALLNIVREGQRGPLLYQVRLDEPVIRKGWSTLEVIFFRDYELK